MRSFIAVMLILSLTLAGLIAEARSLADFEKIDLEINGRNVVVLWRGLQEPDVTIRYCGVNYVYFDPTTKWWNSILVEWNISRYAGSPPLKPDDVDKINEERINIGNALNEAFKRAGAHKHGWVGWLDLGYYFEWEPKVLGIFAYLGGFEVDREAKLNRIKGLLESVSRVLEEYNISNVIINEVFTTIELERLFSAGYSLGRVLAYAMEHRDEVPEVVRRYIAEGLWIAGHGMIFVAGISFNLEPPGRDDLETLIKWIRDRMGHCEVPLEISFNVPIPPPDAVSIRPLIVNQSTHVPASISQDTTIITSTTTSSDQPLRPVDLLAVALVILTIIIGLLVTRRIA